MSTEPAGPASGDDRTGRRLDGPAFPDSATGRSRLTKHVVFAMLLAWLGLVLVVVFLISLA